jgi:hypothetical protein
MTKSIIFGEGSNDLDLIEHAIRTEINPDKIKKFVGEDIDGGIKGRESKAIGNFLEDFNPNQILIKSEGGKTGLKRIFSILITQLYHRNASINILIDLDGGCFDGICEDINERCRGRFTKDVSIHQSECIESNEVLKGYKCGITLNDESRGSFGVIGFEHSMEIAAGIDDQDNSEEKHRRIQALAEKELVQKPIQNVFLQD